VIEKESSIASGARYQQPVENVFILKTLKIKMIKYKKGDKNKNM